MLAKADDGATSDSTSPLTDQKAPDFAFFGIFDGHNGHYVSEALQSSLHPLFLKEGEAETAGGGPDTPLGQRALHCISAACAKLDRAMLGHDFEKQRQLQAERLEESIDMSVQKSGSYIKKTLSFAGTELIIVF